MPTKSEKMVTLSTRGHRVNVSAPKEYLSDIKQFQKLQAVILGKLGCMACTSGFDIRWDIQDRLINPI